MSGHDPVARRPGPTAFRKARAMIFARSMPRSSMPRPLPCDAALALCALIAGAAPALAFDEADRLAVLARADSYEAAVTHRDYSVFVDAVPPRLLSEQAVRSNMDSDTLKQAMRVQVSEAMAGVTLDDFDLETDAMTTGDTRTGRPYALIPTLTTIAQDGAAPARTRTVTLAMKDGGTWYLVRIDGPDQAAALRAAYDDFSGVDLEVAPPSPSGAPGAGAAPAP